MGVCASSVYGRSSEARSIKHYSSSSSLKWTIKIIHDDGKLEEVKQPIKASKITSRSPNYFLCSSESLCLDKWVPHVPEDEELQGDQIYFLLPISQAHKLLSLPDLCGLAVKASSALGCQSNSSNNLIFR